MERPKKAFSQQKVHKYRSGTRYTGGNYIYEVYNAASRRLNHFSNLKLFVLALLAGGIMCLASLLSILLTTDITSSAIQSILSGLGLSLGLILVILTNTILSIEGNVFATGNFYRVSLARGCLRLLRFWMFTWIGNILGAFLFAAIVYLIQEYPDAFRQNLMKVCSMKLTHAGSFNYRGIGELILSGMLANWFVTVVSFFAIASRNFINQFIIIFLAFIFVAATNFQYFPVNLGYFSLNAFLVKSVNLSDAIFYNLIPVALGNILGAAILAVGPFLYLSKKHQS